MSNGTNPYDMELNQIAIVDANQTNGFRMLRVPGGWIYYRGHPNDTTAVFVPIPSRIDDELGREQSRPDTF